MVDENPCIRDGSARRRRSDAGLHDRPGARAPSALSPSIKLPLRVLAVAADLVFGTVLLLGCIYLATHLAVRIVGVGQAEFPPLPVDEYSSDVRSGDSAKI